MQHMHSYESLNREDKGTGRQRLSCSQSSCASLLHHCVRVSCASLGAQSDEAQHIGEGCVAADGHLADCHVLPICFLGRVEAKVPAQHRSKIAADSS